MFGAQKMHLVNPKHGVLVQLCWWGKIITLLCVSPSKIFKRMIPETQRWENCPPALLTLSPTMQQAGSEGSGMTWHLMGPSEYGQCLSLQRAMTGHNYSWGGGTLRGKVRQQEHASKVIHREGASVTAVLVREGPVQMDLVHDGWDSSIMEELLLSSEQRHVPMIQETRMFPSRNLPSEILALQTGLR